MGRSAPITMRYNPAALISIMWVVMFLIVGVEVEDGRFGRHV